MGNKEKKDGGDWRAGSLPIGEKLEGGEERRKEIDGEPFGFPIRERDFCPSCFGVYIRGYSLFGNVT